MPLHATDDESHRLPTAYTAVPAATKTRCTLPSMPLRLSASDIWEYFSRHTTRHLLPAKQPYLPASRATNPPAAVRSAAAKMGCTLPSMPRRFSVLVFGNHSVGTPRGSPTRQADLLPASQATNPPSAIRARSRPAFALNAPLPSTTLRSPNGLALRVTDNESASFRSRTQPPRICIERCTSVHRIHAAAMMIGTSYSPTGLAPHVAGDESTGCRPHTQPQQ